MLFRLVFLLIGASMVGCSHETEPVPITPKAPDEFVPMGPVQAEAEAVSTAWRFILSQPDLYLAPPITSWQRNAEGKQVKYMSFETPLAIDASQPPRVLDHRNDEYGGWVVIWTSRDADFPIPFAINAETGQTEQLELPHF